MLKYAVQTISGYKIKVHIRNENCTLARLTHLRIVFCLRTTLTQSPCHFWHDVLGTRNVGNTRSTNCASCRTITTAIILRLSHTQ